MLFLVAALARLAALLYFPYPEPNYYWTLAENIVTRQQVAFESGPTTYIEPLYRRSSPVRVYWAATPYGWSC